MTFLYWFLLGCIVGLVIWMFQRRVVVNLPAKSVRKAKRMVIGGALLRWVLSAALLANALFKGIVPGLAAFTGLMLFRWLGIFSLRIMPIRAQQKSKRS
jgi:hypothetical protein